MIAKTIAVSLLISFMFVVNVADNVRLKKKQKRVRYNQIQNHKSNCIYDSDMDYYLDMWMIETFLRSDDVFDTGRIANTNYRYIVSKKHTYNAPLYVNVFNRFKSDTIDIDGKKFIATTQIYKQLDEVTP